MQAPVPLTIVFDLDGTLVDTVADIAAALDLALARYGSGATHASDAAAMMGDGLSAFFWRALVAKRLDLPADEAAEAHGRFIAAYRQSPVRLSRMYPGMHKLLGELRRSGVRMAVCTNKVEQISLHILEQLDIRGLFDAVVGHLDDRPKKPDPRPLIEAISLAGGSRDRALLIGDTSADSGAGVAAGIPVILVSYGYSPVSVRALSAYRHVENVHDLRNEIMSFVAADGYAGSRTPVHF